MTSPGGAPHAAKPTIVVCVYNGRNRIGEVLDALAAQRCKPDSFRVVVVDNNSTDGTPDYVRAHPAFAALAAREQAPRVISETRQGLMPARLAGVHAAETDVVCFLDDDNVPERDYVASGAAFFAAHQDAALAVSRVRPIFEIPPARAVLRRRHLFAVNEDLGDRMFAFAPGGMAPTLGAGLWVRKSVFLAVVPWRTPERMIPDRVRNLMVSGNDIEIGVLLDRAGHRRFYVPELRIDHKIPRARLGTRYMTRLITGVVRSQATLDGRVRSPAQRPPAPSRRRAGRGCAARCPSAGGPARGRIARRMVRPRLAHRERARALRRGIRRTMRAASEPTTQRSDKSCAS